MRTGQARRRDWNEAAIVSALEAIGVTVLRVSGAGCPDLFAHSTWQGWMAIEVKQPRGRLTPAQIATRAKAPFAVVRSVTDALALFGVRA